MGAAQAKDIHWMLRNEGASRRKSLASTPEALRLPLELTSGVGEGKVEGPVGRGGERDGLATDLGREDLGGVRPRARLQDNSPSYQSLSSLIG